MNSTQMQYRAFLAVVAATLVVALAPILASVIPGKILPEGLISIADKTTAGYLTLLGTIGGLLFRQSRADEQRVDNTTEAFRAISAAQASSPPAADAIRAGDTVTMSKEPE